MEETREYKGYTIKLIQDEFPQNPREEFDNMGKMVCVDHRNYRLGDEQQSGEEIRELLENEEIISLPLFLYDHSGITMRTTGFNCPWDSGQIGIIYMTLEQVKKEYGKDKDATERALKYMKGEVEEYDHYLTGNVWGYDIEDRDRESIDSCFGFYGDPDSYMVGECESHIEWHIKERIKETWQDTFAILLEAGRKAFRHKKMVLAGII